MQVISRYATGSDSFAATSFGKRWVAKQTTIPYPQIFVEAARVLSDGGKAVLLSADRRTLARSVDLAAGKNLKKQRNFTVNVGGLDALTLVLKNGAIMTHVG